MSFLSLPWKERPRKEKKHLNPDGSENLDPTPMAPPVGYRRQPSLADQIREMVRSERLAMEAEAAGFETFEEADDFDVGDDFDPTTPYEVEFEAPGAREVRERFEQEKPKDPPPPGPKPAQPASPPEEEEKPTPKE